MANNGAGAGTVGVAGTQANTAGTLPASSIAGNGGRGTKILAVILQHMALLARLQ